MSRTWMVASAGRQVTVRGPDTLRAWWETLGPQIPGTPRGVLAETAGAAALVLPDGVTSRDTRLRINARLHAEHLRRGTLSVHGVAVAREERAVLLLGAHGAGKSLTALALITALGWRPVAGDTSLVHNGVAGRGLQVIGGTHAYVVRRGEASRWFPDLVLAGGDREQADVAAQLGRWRAPSSPERASSAVAAVVLVKVESGVNSIDLSCASCPEQVARNAMYRASSHLIDKIQDDPGAEPLRLAETPALARARVRLARSAAASTPFWLLRGSPQAMAAQVDRLAERGGGSR